LREYHGVTKDFIVNEIFRRVDPKKRTLGEFLKEEIHERHELDIHCGYQGKTFKQTAIPPR
jgi:hypothetical protein